MSPQKHITPPSQGTTPEQRTDPEGTRQAGEGLCRHPLPAGDGSMRSVPEHHTEASVGTRCRPHGPCARAPPRVGKRAVVVPSHYERPKCPLTSADRPITRRNYLEE